MSSSRLSGLLGVLVCSLCFGSNYVPVKKYATFDGLVFQWFQCSGILCVGLCVGMVVNWESVWSGSASSNILMTWHGMIGGALWAIGNCLATPTIEFLGLGVAFVIWNETNVVSGWIVGRFEFVGLPPEHVKLETWNVIGLICVVLSLLFLLPIGNHHRDDDHDNTNKKTRKKKANKNNKYESTFTRSRKKRNDYDIYDYSEDDEDMDKAYRLHEENDDDISCSSFDKNIPRRHSGRDRYLGGDYVEDDDLALLSEHKTHDPASPSMTATTAATTATTTRRSNQKTGPFINISNKRSIESKHLRRGRTHSVEFLRAHGSSSNTSLLIVSNDNEIGSQVIEVENDDDLFCDDVRGAKTNVCSNYLDFNVLAREMVMSRIENQNRMYRAMEREAEEERRRQRREAKRRVQVVEREEDGTSDVFVFGGKKVGYKMVGVFLTVLMGICLGNSFTPFLIWRRKERGGSVFEFMFSQTVGIYLFSTAIFVVKGGYSHLMKQKMRQPAMRPAFVSGAVWAIGFAGQLVAVDHLPFVIAYPCTAIGPVFVSTMWSLVYFREIEGASNLRFLGMSMLLILVGMAALIASNG